MNQVTKTLFSFLTLCLFATTGLWADSGQPATVHFDLNECTSYLGNGTNMDYSEFTGMVTNTNDITLTVVGDNLYRLNPSDNKHSCTPGINGTEAMCVSYDPSCDYEANNPYAVRFDIQVDPVGALPTQLADLDFYEMSPEMFDWIDGPSGLNNYPTQYAIRVLKDGDVIYEESDIATTTDWTLQSFDFSDIAEFSVTESSVFSFELHAYCPVGNFAMQSVWDVDEITVSVVCDLGPCVIDGEEVELDGATVTTIDGETELTACVGDIVFDVTNTSTAVDSNYFYVITDQDDNILAYVNSATTSSLDLSGAPPGECHIWGWHQFGQEDPVPGENISTLNDDPCEEISSNFITVNRVEISGGNLAGGPFEFCVGDGVADNIPMGGISLLGNTGTNSAWVITDDQGMILGLPPMPSVVDFDGAGPGLCLVWHLSFEDGLEGAEVGNNAMTDLVGCYSLSNPIEVARNQPEGGTLAGGPFEFCVGDGEADNLMPGDITLTGNSGTNSAWVVTDDQGNILGLPPMPSAVDFDGAGPGTCLVWHLSFEDGLEGAEVGNNAADLEGCFSLSNPIEVVRNQPEGGTLEGGPFEFCVGDSIPDMLAPGSITLSGNSGANSAWVITDDQGNILGLPPMPSVVDFDGAGPGTCLVWHLSFADGLEGAEVGANAADLVGCYSLSNPIEVIRNQPEGGTLTGGPFEFCVGDDEADNLMPGDITLTGNSGTNSAWVVTDEQGNILGLPPMPSAVDFDGAGPGTCLVWHLSYEDGLEGAEVGANAADLEGCFSLSNPISVVRNQPEGGTLEGGPFEFCVGDSIPDMLAPGSITLSGNSGANSAWVITDDQGNILGLPPMPSVVDFDGAGPGTCLVWHLSFADGLEGAEVGANAADLVGCYSLSNPIEVIRNQPEGGTLTGGPFTFCVADGEADNLMPGDITLTGNSGTNGTWVVTDDQGMILGLPPMPSVVDFDGAGVGTCLIWYLSYEDGLEGAEVGNNAADLEGCFSLSNPITVNRVDCTNNVLGGTLTGGPFEFCVGDSIADNVSGITLTGATGTNNAWVITDDLGNILGLPPMPGVVDFDGAGPGLCLIWNISYETGLTGLEVGENVSGLMGTYALSNSISVQRNQPEGGVLAGGPFEFTVGDSIPDMITAGDITLTGNSGTNSAWVVTDDEGYILGLPPMPSVVDFNGAGAGTCLIWHLSYEDGLEGAEVGANAADLEGCFSLSNPIQVIRTNADGCQANGGTIFGGPFEFTVGDGVADTIAVGAVTTTNNQGENFQWVVTDDEGYILGLPPTLSAVNFDGAGPGTCLIWYLAFDGALEGAEVGANAADLVGCFSLSNPIEVIRTDASGCQANGGALFGGPFEFTVGDGIPDTIPAGAITVANAQGENFQWVVTDDEGYILGLPPVPSVVDVDGAGPGTCLLWYLAFDGALEGAEIGANAADLVGCFSLSNPVEIIRTAADGCQANGGAIFGGPFEFTVGDGIPDTIAVGAVTTANNQGENFQWVVTDDAGYILGLPPTLSAVNFDGAGAGTCLIWYLAFDGALEGAEVGANASDLVGCFSLSNPIEVIRTNASGCQANGGAIFGGPFEFTVGDGIADTIAVGAVTTANNQGENFQWVVTDDSGYILGLPPTLSAVNFDGAGAGTCLIWYLAFDGAIEGAEVGANAADLEGCFSLSNPIEVIRTNASGCQANGGALFGGPFSFTVGDGIADTIAMGAVTVANSQGENFQWVVTDDEGYILGLPPTLSAVNFDGAGPGTCLVWYLAYDGALTGAEIGANAADLGGCFSLSNAIEVERIDASGCQANGGALFGGPFEFCVGDNTPDMIPAGSITVANSQGQNTQWVVTDDQGNILGLPPMPSAVDFDGAGVGTCLVWHLAYDGTITGAEVGNNAADIMGCFSLSNAITVNRIDCGGPVTSDSIVINEIAGDNLIEFKNVGNTTIDISDYWICNFPAYSRVGTLAIECGNSLTLEPGDLVTVRADFNVPSNDGEMGLYTTNSFGNVDAIIDYVEWGSSGHQRSGLAAQKGIWTAGDFVPAFDANNSIEYDGAGNTSDDWTEDATTLCMENSLVPRPEREERFAISVYPNPVADNLSIQFENILSETGQLLISDRLGNVVMQKTIDYTDSDVMNLDLTDFPSGYFIVRVISRNQIVTKSFIKVN